MPSILVAAALAIGPALTFALLSAIYRRLTSPLRYVPGPKSASFIVGWREKQETVMVSHSFNMSINTVTQ